MKFEILFSLITLSFFAFACASAPKQEPQSSTTGGGAQSPKRPQYVITATQNGVELGQIVIETFPDITPEHARNFDSLVTTGFYNGTKFHRVIPGFVIQGGDPNTKNKPENTWGMGDPSQRTIPAEFHDKVLHNKGVLSMARKGGDINSGTSQFFITVADVHFLDPSKPDANGKYTDGYTVFGRVLSGMDVVDKIVNTPTLPGDRPKQNIDMTITKVK